jgi:hypothetical protein
MKEIIKRLDDVGFISLVPKEVLEITSLIRFSKVGANL